MGEIIDFRTFPLGPWGDGVIVVCPDCGEHALFGEVIGEVYRQYVHTFRDGKPDLYCNRKEYIG
jgi:hypothetical protein